MDAEELMEVEIARLRELHAAGAISDSELRSGIDEARLGAGLAPVADDPRQQIAGRRVSTTPIILAFVAVDIVIVIAVLVFLLAD